MVRFQKDNDEGKRWIEGIVFDDDDYDYDDYVGAAEYEWVIEYDCWWETDYDDG